MKGAGATSESKRTTCCPLLAALAVVIMLSFLVLFSPACSNRSSESGSGSTSLPADFPSGKPYFVRVPPPVDWRTLSRPVRSFDMAKKWGPLYDLRHADLSRLDLADRAQDLRDTFFDTETKWPAGLPLEFDPAKILELNRNPGLGIRSLHTRGITGKGVAAAIIDTPFLLDHDEYAGRVRYYGEANAWGPANFHGTLVASILAGRTCGVAPEAEIYYVGSHNFDVSPADNSTLPNSTHYAMAINKLLEVNARLSPGKKIRVISISAGWSPKNRGFKAMNKAVQRATEAGIFVVSGNVIDMRKPGFWFWGLDRASSDHPDDVTAYRVPSWNEWISQVRSPDRFDVFFEKRFKGAGSPELLLIPESSKTVAQAGGLNEYGFYRVGGWSSLLPYIAGLYALACQVKPDITPEVFWKAALATGDPMPVEGKKTTHAGKRVNPARLMESLW